MKMSKALPGKMPIFMMAASIAVGKTAGLAPKADLYYIARGNCSLESGDFADFDFSCLAKDVLRVVEINKSLPEDARIRVVTMEVGWDSSQNGYEAITAAVNQAKAAGIFVVSSSLEESYGFKLNGLGRDILADPNQFDSYTAGSWWAQYFFEGKYTLDNTLLFPMDARAGAGCTGKNVYVFYGQGGWSWVTPYIAGMYALAYQVNPGITPDEFWSTGLKTGQIIQIDQDGKRFSFGKILDPQALIAELEK
jgi:hypothetical protein